MLHQRGGGTAGAVGSLEARCVIADDEPPARRLLRRFLDDRYDMVVAAEGGSGRVAVDGSGWMPLQVSALYDVASATAVAQQLSLGAAEGRLDPYDGLLERLSVETSRRLEAEFDGQPTHLELAGLEARAVGNGLVALKAIGRTDFAGEGVAETSVHALYDPAQDRWLRLQYRLGGGGMTESVAGL